MDHQKDSGDPLGLTKQDLETIFEATFNEQAGEGEKRVQNKPLNTPLFDGSFEPKKSDGTPESMEDSQSKNFKTGGDSSRSKSSLRIKYEAEVSAIKKTHGELEAIRRKLGLSKRKVAQLLLVDPSAWTRWTTEGGEAPPHIYRALEWFLLLQEKQPQYKSALWLNSVATPSLSEHEIENIKNTVVDRARDALDHNVPFYEHESVDLTPLQRQLKISQRNGKKLNQRIQWLIFGQALLLLGLILSLLF